MEQRRLDTWEPLPPKVHRKNNAFYLVHENRWHHLGRYHTAALRRYLELAEQLGIPAMHADFLRALFSKAKSRAKRLRRPFTLTQADFDALWERSGGRCMLTGIPFDVGNALHFKRRPYIPSLDRIDSTQGYVAGNVRLICFAMNAALNAWGEDMFRKLAEGYLTGLMRDRRT